MNFVVKNFSELSKEELYEILRVRSLVFVTELKMNCQDIDGVDFRAHHLYLEQDGEIFAYLRAFFIDDETIRIGRVLSVNRGVGLGADIMKRSIDYIKANTSAEKITLDSQKQAVGFYEKLGFKAVSDEFLEEGVLHVKMELEI